MSRDKVKTLLTMYICKVSPIESITKNLLNETHEIVDEIIDTAVDEAVDKIRSMIQLGQLEREEENR